MVPVPSIGRKSSTAIPAAARTAYGTLKTRRPAVRITNTINIFQPDILCIGGGVCNEGDPLLLPLKELVAKEVYTKNSAKNTEIVIAKLGNDAGIIGAAFLGLSHKK